MSSKCPRKDLEKSHQKAKNQANRCQKGQQRASKKALEMARKNYRFFWKIWRIGALRQDSEKWLKMTGEAPPP